MEKISTAKAPAAIGPYSQAIAAGGFLYTSGQIPLVPETGVIEAKDIAGQTRQACQNLGAVLEAAGIGFENVVKTVCFLADMEDFAAFNEVYAQYFTGRPARSCVAVKTLPKGALCEIECVASLGD